MHITNGDAAAQKIRVSGATGTIIPWRDVLHEGPVLAGLSLDRMRSERARFIASCGWAAYDQVLADFGRRDSELSDFRSHDEVVLWFEHDLYDQLQLLQLLAWFAEQDLSGTVLTIVPAEDYIGPADPDLLRELYLARHQVTPDMLRLGQIAWQAFCSSDPSAITELLRGDTAALPYLSSALKRQLQQFPSTINGLSRSEEQVLLAVESGSLTPRDAFLAAQAAEEHVFLGDTTFAWYMQRLSLAEQALLKWADGVSLGPPGKLMTQEEFQGRNVVITDLGRAVLNGEADWIAVAGIDRWLGGAHLTTSHHWRWNRSESHLERRIL